MKVVTTKTRLIAGKRVRAGVEVDIKLPKGVKLPADLIPVEKVKAKKKPKEIETMSEMAHASSKPGKEAAQHPVV